MDSSRPVRPFRSSKVNSTGFESISARISKFESQKSEKPIVVGKPIVTLRRRGSREKLNSELNQLNRQSLSEKVFQNILDNRQNPVKTYGNPRNVESAQEITSRPTQLNRRPLTLTTFSLSLDSETPVKPNEDPTNRESVQDIASQSIELNKRPLSDTTFSLLLDDSKIPVKPNVNPRNRESVQDIISQSTQLNRRPLSDTTFSLSLDDSKIPVKPIVKPRNKETVQDITRQSTQLNRRPLSDTTLSLSLDSKTTVKPIADSKSTESLQDITTQSTQLNRRPLIDNTLLLLLNNNKILFKSNVNSRNGESTQEVTSQSTRFNRRPLSIATFSPLLNHANNLQEIKHELETLKPEQSQRNGKVTLEDTHNRNDDSPSPQQEIKDFTQKDIQESLTIEQKDIQESLTIEQKKLPTQQSVELCQNKLDLISHDSCNQTLPEKENNEIDIVLKTNDEQNNLTEKGSQDTTKNEIKRVTNNPSPKQTNIGYKLCVMDTRKRITTGVNVKSLVNKMTSVEAPNKGDTMEATHPTCKAEQLLLEDERIAHIPEQPISGSIQTPPTKSDPNVAVTEFQLDSKEFASLFTKKDADDYVSDHQLEMKIPSKVLSTVCVVNDDNVGSVNSSPLSTDHIDSQATVNTNHIIDIPKDENCNITHPENEIESTLSTQHIIENDLENSIQSNKPQNQVPTQTSVAEVKKMQTKYLEIPKAEQLINEPVQTSLLEDVTNLNKAQCQLEILSSNVVDEDLQSASESSAILKNVDGCVSDHLEMGNLGKADASICAMNDDTDGSVSSSALCTEQNDSRVTVSSKYSPGIPKDVDHCFIVHPKNEVEFPVSTQHINNIELKSLKQAEKLKKLAPVPPPRRLVSDQKVNNVQNRPAVFPNVEGRDIVQSASRGDLCKQEDKGAINHKQLVNETIPTIFIESDPKLDVIQYQLEKPLLNIVNKASNSELDSVSVLKNVDDVLDHPLEIKTPSKAATSLYVMKDGVVGLVSSPHLSMVPDDSMVTVSSKHVEDIPTDMDLIDFSGNNIESTVSVSHVTDNDLVSLKLNEKPPMQIPVPLPRKFTTVPKEYSTQTNSAEMNLVNSKESTYSTSEDDQLKEENKLALNPEQSAVDVLHTSFSKSDLNLAVIKCPLETSTLNAEAKDSTREFDYELEVRTSDQAASPISALNNDIDGLVSSSHFTMVLDDSMVTVSSTERRENVEYVPKEVELIDFSENEIESTASVHHMTDNDLMSLKQSEKSQMRVPVPSPRRGSSTTKENKVQTKPEEIPKVECMNITHSISQEDLLKHEDKNDTNLKHLVNEAIQRPLIKSEPILDMIQSQPEKPILNIDDKGPKSGINSILISENLDDCTIDHQLEMKIPSTAVLSTHIENTHTNRLANSSPLPVIRRDSMETVSSKINEGVLKDVDDQQIVHLKNEIKSAVSTQSKIDNVEQNICFDNSKSTEKPQYGVPVPPRKKKTKHPNVENLPTQVHLVEIHTSEVMEIPNSTTKRDLETNRKINEVESTLLTESVTDDNIYENIFIGNSKQIEKPQNKVPAPLQKNKIPHENVNSLLNLSDNEEINKEDIIGATLSTSDRNLFKQENKNETESTVSSQNKKDTVRDEEFVNPTPIPQARKRRTKRPAPSAPSISLTAVSKPQADSCIDSKESINKEQNKNFRTNRIHSYEEEIYKVNSLIEEEYPEKLNQFPQNVDDNVSDNQLEPKVLSKGILPSAVLNADSNDSFSTLSKLDIEMENFGFKSGEKVSKNLNDRLTAYSKNETETPVSALNNKKKNEKTVLDSEVQYEELEGEIQAQLKEFKPRRPAPIPPSKNGSNLSKPQRDSSTRSSIGNEELFKEDRGKTKPIDSYEHGSIGDGPVQEEHPQNTSSGRLLL